MTISATLREKLDALPDAPGVYLLKDRRGAVIYVGKARSLKARVRSYFGAAGADERPLLPYLRPRIADLDTLQVSNEKEAFLLEDSLIKQHQPRYNVRLLDDKTYLSLRLDRRRSFARFVTVRRPKPDGARYFGPYASARSVRDTLKVIYRSFGIRSCTDAVFANRSRPCLYYQIGQCSAPCVGYISAPDYDKALDQAELLLRGRHSELRQSLVRQMAEAAESERFEQAAVLRDRIQSIERTVENQGVAAAADLDFDVIGHHGGDGRHGFVWLFIRDGHVVGSDTLLIENRAHQPLGEFLGNVLSRAYEARPLPPELLLPVRPDDEAALLQVLAERRGRPLRLLVPERGRKRKLLAMASTNAAAALALDRRRAEREAEVLEALQSVLGLTRLPRRIECFDISHLGGTLTVGSMSVVLDGAAAPSEYRRYRVQQAMAGDDYASLAEVLRRRLKRGLAERNLPDLLLVDGGRGQLATAATVAAELGIEGLPLVGIAKGPQRNSGRESLHTLSGSPPLKLAPDDPRLQLLQRLRDEAHRFAISFNRRLRKSRDRGSALDRIPGIGAARKRALLLRFGSVAGIGRASLAELVSVAGISAATARAVQTALEAPEAAAGSGPGARDR